MKWILRGAVALGILVTFAGAGGYFWLRTSLPQVSGARTVPGLAATVEITRDAQGIPHIRAESSADALFALGFVHAQDRLFQMEFSRLLGQGRLSEVVGAATVRIDRMIRTFDIPGLARASLARLSPEAREALESYSRGVNAFLATRDGALPPEFYALRHRPERWRPADSLLWGRLMAFRLSGDWRLEALREALSNRLDPARLAQLWPGPHDSVPPTVTGDAGAESTGRMLAGVLKAFPEELNPVTASNSWGVAGARTETGKPILSNDPHLGFQAPGLWYLARIDAPGLTATGATVPGVPFVILGHNDSVAWAFTTHESDTQDLFVEKVNPRNNQEYLTPAGWRPFETRQEIIRVRGAAPVNLTVRRTRHGPVVSDIRPGLAGDSEGTVVALAAMAFRHDDETAEAMYRFNRAQNAQQFLAALEKFHSPHQNVTFADVSGTLGFVAAGRVPIRRRGTGYRPVAGWDGRHDWTGTIPFRELPRTIDPPNGRIVNANHRAAPPAYPYYLGTPRTPAYRASRIQALLSTDSRHTLETSAAMQSDSLSLMARDLVPLLTASDFGDSRTREALALLRAWDGRMDRSRPEPLIFVAWLRQLNRRLYADELGPLFFNFWSLRPVFVKRALAHHPEWCDDTGTPAKEDCAAQIAASLSFALKELTESYGEDLASWRWGDPHHARFRHPVFGRIPVLRSLADIEVPSDGGPFTVNRAQPRIGSDRRPYASVHGPGYRAIYDLDDLERSRFMVATGQSGNPLSPYYDDLNRDWRDGKYVQIRRRADPAAAIGTLRLTPGK